MSVDLETLRSHFTFSGPSLISTNEKVLLEIHHAINNSHCFWMNYFTASRGERTERKVHPYHLYNMRGDWYLIAFDEMRKEFRNFLVGRIEAWKVLPDKNQRDMNFSVSDWMGGAFQAERSDELTDVAIKFDAITARYVRERNWHASQKIEENEDGSLVLHLQTSGLGEVKRWVMQYGCGAEVLSPESLRQACIEEIKNMANTYSG